MSLSGLFVPNFIHQMITLQALVRSNHGKATITYLTGSTNSQAEEELTVIHWNMSIIFYYQFFFLSNRTYVNEDHLNLPTIFTKTKEQNTFQIQSHKKWGGGGVLLCAGSCSSHMQIWYMFAVTTWEKRTRYQISSVNHFNWQTFLTIHKYKQQESMNLLHFSQNRKKTQQERESERESKCILRQKTMTTFNQQTDG
jgi:hypothetical protein